QCTMTSNSTCASTTTAVSQVITMTVNNSLVPTVSASGPTTFCQGDNVVLTSSAAAGYLWSPGGETTQSITVNAAGTYSVTVNDGTGCSGSDAGTTVVVNAVPVVTLSAFTPVCDTIAAFALTGGSPAGGTYSGTGVSNGNFDPAVSGAGTFQIIYSYTNTDGCTNESAADLTVNTCSSGGCTSAPDAPVHVTGPSRIYCNQTGIVYSISPVATATSYAWTVPAGITITSNTGTSITVDQDSSFHGGLICVSAVNACGTSPQKCRFVREGRMILSYIHGPHEVCRTDAAVTYSISPVAGAVSYAWTIGGGASLTSNGTSAVVDFTSATLPWMLLRVAVTDACGNVRYRSMWIHVKQHCNGHDDGDDDDDDDGDDENGGDRIAVASFNYAVYPNPSSGMFQVDLNMVQGTQATLRMVDIYGKQVSEKMVTLEAGNNTVSYDVVGLAPGVYILNIEVSGEGVKTQRLIITK
ncbi:MAG TPA: T9SS type A sorting domain-containing protein, partial [Bacteroidia bacterium]|nr:T9SS type A sorting domain-containing protein [Bacteroidia bacterium]